MHNLVGFLLLSVYLAGTTSFFFTPASLAPAVNHVTPSRLLSTCALSAVAAGEVNELLEDYETQLASEVQRVFLHSETSAHDPAALSEFLIDCGALGVTLVDGDKGTDEEEPIFDEIIAKDLPKTSSILTDSSRQVFWDNSTIIAIYPKDFDIEVVVDQIEAVFPSLAPVTYAVEPVQEEDWVKTVQEEWDPIDMTERVRVRFPWHEPTPPHELLAEGRTEIVLEGGRAFGTGDHPTTSMCASWLEKAVLSYSAASPLGEKDSRVRATKEKETTEARLLGGPRVLDYGSGSGILGLVALRLGASEAVGVEIDMLAILVSIANARANGLHMDFYLPRERDDDLDDPSAEVIVDMMPISHREGSGVHGEYEFEEGEKAVVLKPFPIVVANILASSLNHLEPVLSGLVESGGKLALSGILSSQADSVVEAYSQDFDIAVTQTDGDWVLVSGTKKT